MRIAYLNNLKYIIVLRANYNIEVLFIMKSSLSGYTRRSEDYGLSARRVIVTFF